MPSIEVLNSAQAVESAPSDPVERKVEGLPPKSYADAAHDAPPGNSHTNGAVKHPYPSSTPAGPKDAQKRSAERDGAKAALANMDDASVLETRVEANGSTLTSTRAPKGYFAALAESKKEQLPAPDKTISMERVEEEQLTSGRQAGQRWERSAYVVVDSPSGA